MSETIVTYDTSESTHAINPNEEIKKMVKKTNAFLRSYIKISTDLQTNEIIHEENRLFTNTLQYITIFITENKHAISKMSERFLPEAEINYVSGKSEEYFIIRTKEGGLLRVPKPKDPLMELKKLGEKIQTRPLVEIKKELRQTLEEEIGGK